MILLAMNRPTTTTTKQEKEKEEIQVKGEPQQQQQQRVELREEKNGSCVTDPILSAVFQYHGIGFTFHIIVLIIIKSSSSVQTKSLSKNLDEVLNQESIHCS